MSAAAIDAAVQAIHHEYQLFCIQQAQQDKHVPLLSQYLRATAFALEITYPPKPSWSKRQLAILPSIFTMTVFTISFPGICAEAAISWAVKAGE